MSDAARPSRPDSTVERATVGILVGGQSRRMGGRPKGLLRAADRPTTIIERSIEECRKLSLPVDIVLLGRHDAYAHLGLEQWHDSPAGVGPLGGLCALLERADPAHPAVLLACDMPFVTALLLERLLSSAPQAPALAPQSCGRWIPTFARYEPQAAKICVRTLLARGETALFAVLDELGAQQLPLSSGEEQQITDWDCPADVRRR